MSVSTAGHSSPVNVEVSSTATLKPPSRPATPAQVIEKVMRIVGESNKGAQQELLKIYSDVGISALDQVTGTNDVRAVACSLDTPDQDYPRSSGRIDFYRVLRFTTAHQGTLLSPDEAIKGGTAPEILNLLPDAELVQSFNALLKTISISSIPHVSSLVLPLVEDPASDPHWEKLPKRTELNASQILELANGRTDKMYAHIPRNLSPEAIPYLCAIARQQLEISARVLGAYIAGSICPFLESVEGYPPVTIALNSETAKACSSADGSNWYINAINQTIRLCSPQSAGRLRILP